MIEDLLVVREQLNDDNDPTGEATTHVLTGCSVVARLPASDSTETGESITKVLDVRCPDRDADVLGTDRVRRPGEDPTARARWRVEGEPTRSPFPGGAVVFVLRRQAG